MTLHTLSSGSQGNCLLLSDGDTHILVDAGISTRRIKAGLAQLELSMDELDGILITHEHTDHISGLATLIKHHSVPLYASPGTARQLAYRLARRRSTSWLLSSTSMPTPGRTSSASGVT